jgi:hypothetical protein
MGVIVTKAQIQVMTQEGIDSAPKGVGSTSNGIWALYDISATLVPQCVFFSDRYRFLHENLSAEGKIKHTLDACPERLKPISVREWSPQDGWKTILLPPIEPRTLNLAKRR